ncbi:hypothetical protein BKA70DRAFT_1387755 [Coprinopsis sp. MPI-PUGE-AT-0042]|nr:hypothetical protein BKA70DRAFT_1387755 [Coprinopsis sp. MPI-PUGE-AT-0042]
MRGQQLFETAEKAYMLQRDEKKAFEYYQKAIKKVLNDENVLTPCFNRRPAGVPDDFPSELLAMVFRNFCGFFKDPAMNFTEATAPEAFKLLSSFRPNRNQEHTRFTSTRAQFLLKCLQIETCLTLGILAWDVKDRATAAKRYQEALDIAATEPVLSSPKPPVGLETWISNEVAEIRDNLAILVGNDTLNSSVLEAQGLGGGDLRRDVVNVPMVRIDAKAGNTPTQEDSVITATDACGKCAKRGIKLNRCSRCKTRAYCGVECQKADWKAHKPHCVPT